MSSLDDIGECHELKIIVGGVAKYDHPEPEVGPYPYPFNYTFALTRGAPIMYKVTAAVLWCVSVVAGTVHAQQGGARHSRLR